MKKKLLRTLPLVAFTLAFAIIFGADLYMSFHLRTLIERSRLVTRTLQVRGKLDETLQLLTDLETAPRGYVITGQEEFLEPYFAALAPEDGIKKHINELRQLSATNPAQQAYLDMLEPLQICTYIERFR